MGVADQEARTTCGLNCVSVWRAGFSPKCTMRNGSLFGPPEPPPTLIELTG